MAINGYRWFISTRYSKNNKIDDYIITPDENISIPISSSIESIDLDKSEHNERSDHGDHSERSEIEYLEDLSHIDKETTIKYLS
jgi:hypothetical protein